MHHAKQLLKDNGLTDNRRMDRQ